MQNNNNNNNNSIACWPVKCITVQRYLEFSLQLRYVEIIYFTWFICWLGPLSPSSYAYTFAWQCCTLMMILPPDPGIIWKLHNLFLIFHKNQSLSFHLTQVSRSCFPLLISVSQNWNCFALLPLFLFYFLFFVFHLQR